jgi:hypothetical protein
MLGNSDQSAAYGTSSPDTPLADPATGGPPYPGASSGGAHSIGASSIAGRRTGRVPAEVKVKGGGTLAAVGLLTVLFGAWAAIVPYVGPAFGFGATGTPAWRWSLLHSLLWLAPGAVALVCGLVMVAKVPSLRNGRGGGSAGVAGLVTVLCGAWLAIGLLAWRVLERGSVFTGGSPWREFLTRVGYSYGPAVILAMLGGVAMGVVVGRRLTGVAMSSGSIPAGTNAIPTGSSQPF